MSSGMARRITNKLFSSKNLNSTYRYRVRTSYIYQEITSTATCSTSAESRAQMGKPRIPNLAPFLHRFLIPKSIPRPGIFENYRYTLKGMNVLLISNARNNMVNRVHQALEFYSVNSFILETTDPVVMEVATNALRPDVIVCPFLTAKIPETIYKRPDLPCLIVHPGIPGDRGPSSIDWAIYNETPKWGVTVLEADDEMDGGDIWCSSTFEIDKKVTKTGMYNGQLADAAVESVLEALVRFKIGAAPIRLDYDHPEVHGNLQPSMKNKNRMIDWNDHSYDIVKKIRMSDTRPGAIGTIKVKTEHGLEKKQFRLYDGHVENRQPSELLRRIDKCTDGEIVGHCYGHILIKAGSRPGKQDLLWTGQLRDMGKSQLKLPAVSALPKEWLKSIPDLSAWAWEYSDLNVQRKGDIAYVHFDFYNGAMDKNQCARLEYVLKQLSRNDRIKTVVLMGGDRFFSTGIHLNVIEGSENPARESWENINKINDAIKAMFSMKGKLTVAALQGNAGAGGVMMAAAADVVIAHPGVELTPSYTAMNLFGSEYWTYFFPRRVGHSNAKILMSTAEPISSYRAEDIGLVDYVLGGYKGDFREDVSDFLETFTGSDGPEAIIRRKNSERDDAWFEQLERHREYELTLMKACFQSDDYNLARRNFVYH